jgi:hypothetical protein
VEDEAFRKRELRRLRPYKRILKEYMNTYVLPNRKASSHDDKLSDEDVIKSIEEALAKYKIYLSKKGVGSPEGDI